MLSLPNVLSSSFSFQDGILFSTQCSIELLFKKRNTKMSLILGEGTMLMDSNEKLSHTTPGLDAVSITVTQNMAKSNPGRKSLVGLQVHIPLSHLRK